MRLLLLCVCSVSLVSQVAAQQLPPVWSLERDFLFGSVDGPNALGTIGSVLVSPVTGWAYLTMQSQEIVVISPEGRMLNRFGRRGGGPGEFENLGSVSWIHPHVVAMDPITRRQIRFTADGEHVETRSVELPRPGAPIAYLSVRAPLAGGTVLGFGHDSVEDSQEIRTTGVLYRIDTDSGYLVEIDRIQNFGHWLKVPGTGLQMPVPAQDRSLYAVHPHGESVVVVHQYVPVRRDSGFFRIRSVAADGSVIFARNYPYVPQPLGNDFLAMFAEGYSETLQRSGTTPRAVERLLADRGGISRYEAPVSQVRAGADGTIWLRSWPGASGSVVWSVFDRRGDPVGRLELPEDVRLYHFDGDVVWGVEYDDFGVNYLARYRIRR